MSRVPEYAVGFVGGGFRTTTFLASAWPLPGAVAVFETGDRLGPGAFAEFTTASSSVGSRLLQHVRFDGPFARLRGHPAVAAVAAADTPVQLRAVAEALGAVGSVLLGCGVRLHPGARVTSVQVDQGRAGVWLRTAGGAEIGCGHVVLASGREERPHPDLDRWREVVWLSGRVLSAAARPVLVEWLAGLGGRPVVIAGCSHSAMSALEVVLQAGRQLRDQRPGYRPPPVVVLHRGPVRLMYPSVEQARAQQQLGRELIFRPGRDVCPSTGIVFRDSGLRGRSAELFCAAWAGRLPGVRIVHAARLADAAGLLEQAGLIVQALGYRGRVPDIVIDGVLARPAGSGLRLHGDDDGAVLLGGRRCAGLSVLRAEPTPRRLRDNTGYGSGLYPRLAGRLRRATGVAR